MISQKQISVIIPAYNAEMSLTKCVDSVLNQSFSDVEIIVINDGSIDNTDQVAKEFKNQIIYIKQSNKGQGAARNAGLKVASGEYIAFLDADDYWKPDFLETTVSFLENNPDAIAVNTGHMIKKFGQDHFGPVLSEEDKQQYKNGKVIDNFYEFWARYDHVRTGTVLIRKRVIDKAGFQRADLRISQDLEYWGYIASFGKWGFLPSSHWVGDSASVAAKSGWNKKYEKRRKLCPTVESWEQRIVPRLKPDDFKGFKAVRGRVAGSFAFNKILGGDDIGSKHIAAKYGNDMPAAWTSRLMLIGLNGGQARWNLICSVLRYREIFKSWLIYHFPIGPLIIFKIRKSLKNFKIC